MESIENKVDSISTEWDQWIERNGLESLQTRRNKIEEKIKNLLIEIDENENLKEIRKHLLRAKLLTVLPEFNSEAKEILERVLKRDPANYEAWNLLGEQYWRCSNVKMAKNCFESGLNKKNNSVSLRALSMILRSLPETNQKNKLESIKLSFRKAKNAVDLDEENGSNWYVLGNAYLTLFVHSVGAIKQELMGKAYDAYAKAEKLGQSYNPDLHYNRAQLFLYDEKWKETYESLLMASQYDPQWELPKEKFKNVSDFCRQVVKLCENRGKLGGKKMSKLMKKLEDKNDILCIAVLSHFEYLPFTFIGIDADSKTFLVTVYNIERGKGPIIGDVVNVNKFNPAEVQFDLKEEKIKFSSKRIDDIESVKLNGKKLSTNAKTNVQNLNMI
jgi:tetratricopeptide (TPR) repeat protein